MYGIIEEKQFKILIADDVVLFRNSIASRLRVQRHSVDFADGGFHLLHLIEKEKDYNLIIIHENMHDMSAEEMVLLIRTMKNKKELPILYISKISEELKIFEMVAKGANDYIIKSTNFQPILEKVQKYQNMLNIS